MRTRIKSTRHQRCRNSTLFRTGNLRSEISLLTPCRHEDFAIFEGATLARGLRACTKVSILCVRHFMGRRLDIGWVRQTENRSANPLFDPPRDDFDLLASGDWRLGNVGDALATGHLVSAAFRQFPPNFLVS